MLEVLIVCEGGQKYGIALEQIAEIAEVESEVELSLAGLLRTKAVQEGSQKMLRIKGAALTPVLVKEPEEIVSLAVRQILALPEILRKAAALFGIWAVARRGEELLLLLDLHQNSLFKESVKCGYDARQSANEGGNNE